MSTRYITLKIDEEFHALLKGHAEFLGYESIENYTSDLIISHVLDATEELDRFSDSIELEFDEEYGYLEYDDNIPF